MWFLIGLRAILTSAIVDSKPLSTPRGTPMSRREEYVKKVRNAIAEMQVKASLAKLEARDVRDDLVRRYDAVQDRLHTVSEAAEDRWDALREGCDAAWTSFKTRFDEVMREHRGRRS